MHTSLFRQKPTPFQGFDFRYFSLLLVENRLLNWIGEKKSDGTTISSLDDFFQSGYIVTQMEAFFWGLDHLQDTLNFAWINHLHRLATDKLYHEFNIGNDQSPEIEKEIRKTESELIFPGLIHRMIGAPAKESSEGLKSLEQQLIGLNDSSTQGKAVFLIERFDLEEGRAVCNTVDADTAKKYYDQQLTYYHDNAEEIDGIVSDIPVHPAELFCLAFIFNDEQKEKINLGENNLIIRNHAVLLSSIGYKLLDRNPFEIRGKAERLIDEYNKKDKSTHGQIIDAIIVLVKGLLNLHVWPDGNGRVCAHLLLNLLLIRNGLSPALLVNNCLDAFTLEELEDRVVDGMQLFKRRCTEKTNMLESYRKANNFFKREDESLFVQTILSNQFHKAKEYILTTTSYYHQDIEVFSCCPEADLSWFLPYFEKNSTLYAIESDEKCILASFIDVLADFSIDYGNKNLLLSIVSYVGNSALYSFDADIFIKILTYGTPEIFSAFQCYLEENLKLFNSSSLFEIIAKCRNETNSLFLLDWWMQSIKDGNYHKYVDLKMLKFTFLKQTPTVLLKYIDVGILKGFPLKDIYITVAERTDLMEDQKKTILEYIDPEKPYKPKNPLNDFLFCRTERKSRIRKCNLF